MRKEDRIRQQQSHPDQSQPDRPRPPEQDRMKGSGEMDRPQPPQRPSGKLPLPD